MSEGGIAFYGRSVYYGGIERNIVRQSHILKKTGFNVYVIALKGSSIAKTFTHSDIELITVDNEKLSTIRQLSKQLLKKQVRVVFLYKPADLRTGFLIKLFSKFNIKIAFNQQERIKADRFIFFRTLLIRWTDFWMTPMNYLSNDIRKQFQLGKKEINIIPHCLDLEPYLINPVSTEDARKQLNLPVDRKIIGILGRHNLEKRQDFLIRAINFLKLNDFSYDLLIMGNPKKEDEQEYYHFLKDLAVECGLEKQVFFRSYIDNIQTFYRAIDVFIKTTSGEACDITAIEALASGTQVMAIQSKYNSEILANGALGMLYKANDLEDFSNKLIKILTQQKIKDYLREEGLKTVTNKYHIKNDHPFISLAYKLLSKKNIVGLSPVEINI